MSYAAIPRLCPVCDCAFDDKHAVDETIEVWLHFRLKRKCVRQGEEEWTQAIDLPDPRKGPDYFGY